MSCSILSSLSCCFLSQCVVVVVVLVNVCCFLAGALKLPLLSEAIILFYRSNNLNR